MANTQVTLAARKTGEVWEAALVQDGKFMRAYRGERGEELGSVIGVTLMTLLAVTRNEGTEVALTLMTNEPDAQ